MLKLLKKIGDITSLGITPSKACAWYSFDPFCIMH